MIIKAVLDTNVVVSANLVDEGPSAAILDLAINKAILMVVSPPVLEEYEKVLDRPRLTLDAAKGDESDNRFLECAGAAQADYIVTGNTKHFPELFEQSRVVTPRQFIDVILPALAEQNP